MGVSYRAHGLALELLGGSRGRPTHSLDFHVKMEKGTRDLTSPYCEQHSVYAMRIMKCDYFCDPIFLSRELYSFLDYIQTPSPCVPFRYFSLECHLIPMHANSCIMSSSIDPYAGGAKAVRPLPIYASTNPFSRAYVSLSHLPTDLPLSAPSAVSFSL